MFAAILDTNILWPSLQRDFLLSMAAEGLYRPLWSTAILAELEFHERRKLLERDTGEAQAEQRARRLVARMEAAFRGATVLGWEPLEGSFGLPDKDDEHVLAAAVMGGAGALVTDNLKDFPLDRVPETIQVLTGRDFAADTASVDPRRAAKALIEISRRHVLTTHRPHQLLDLLVKRNGMHDVDDLVRPVLDEMSGE